VGVAARVREAGLWPIVCQLAETYGVAQPPDLLSVRVRRGPIVRARHALWCEVVRSYPHWSVRKVAGIFGVTCSAIRWSLSRQGRITAVLLDEFQGEQRAIDLWWAEHRARAYGVVDRVSNRATWYGSIDRARSVFEAMTSGSLPTRAQADLGGGR